MESLQQLIQDCANNNRLSQKKLYLKFYPSLFLLCKRFFKDDQDALEILNDGMVKVFKNIENYKPDNGSFFNWIYTIVQNTALDKLRLLKPPLIKELNEHMESSFAENPLKSLEWKDVYKLLDTLTPATRAVCCLFYLEGFSIKEISEGLNLSKGTIKWHLSETRRKLKVVFKDYYS